MGDGLTPYLIAYVAGVAWGLFKGDAPLRGRMALSLLWPLGPLAFALTLLVLIGTAAMAFPWFGLLLGAALIGLWVRL